MSGPGILDVRCAVTLGAFDLDALSSWSRYHGSHWSIGGRQNDDPASRCGSDAADRGSIAVNGDVMADTEARVFVPPHKRRIGLVFQDAQLFPHLTVAQNLAFGGRFARHQNGLPREHVIDVLGHRGAPRPVAGALSGGEKGRVAEAARTLLDQISAPASHGDRKPLAGLDDDKRQTILPLIETVRDEFGVPMLYVTHARDEAQRLANRIITLDRGRVAASENLE